jgi:hypothetical protein
MKILLILPRQQNRPDIKSNQKEGAMKSLHSILLPILTLILVSTAQGQDSLHVSRLSQYANFDVAHGVAVYGSYAYLADEYGGLRIINISNPTAPVAAGYYDTPGSAYGVVISGQYAYVSDGSSGLRIIDISNPSAPFETGSIDTPGDASNLVIAGSYAYIADWDSGLRVIDISNTTHPIETGSCMTPSFAGDVAVEGNYAYVTDLDSGLCIIYIADPTIPRIVGHYNLPFWTRTVTVVGSTAYLGQNNHLLIIDVSTPTTPTLIGSYLTSSYVMDIAVVGALAYVANYGDGMTIIDISNPANPYQVGQYSSDYNDARGIDVLGSHAYLADSPFGLKIIDVSNPFSPVISGLCCQNGSIKSVAIAGPYAYGATRSSHTQVPSCLQIFNISNPNAPQLMAFCNIPSVDSDASGIALAGNYAYVSVDYSGLWVFNVSNPLAPIVVGHCNSPTITEDVTVSGSYAYVAGQTSGLYIINISNPAIPVVSGVYNTPGSADGVALLGSYAYIADGNSGLRIINVSNPSSPVEVGYYDTPGMAKDVVVVGSFAYVADDANLRVINISNPTAPVEVGHCALTGICYRIAISGNYLSVANFENGLQVVDISNPTVPVEAGFYNLSGQYSNEYFNDVAFTGNTSYLAGAEYFRICQFTPPSIDVGLSPTYLPIQIPANGGSFPFIASVQRTIGPQAPFTVWARIKNPNGSYTNPTLGPIVVNPPVNVTLTRLRTQSIPHSWAPGSYTYLGYANSSFSYPTIDSSFFTFTKLASGTGPNVWDLTCTGEPFPDEQTAATNFHPSDFKLYPCHPNPFNSSTLIRFELPLDDNVSLKMFDTSGRLVSTLLDGRRTAGTYEVIFDGSGLASGLYFAHLEARNHTATHKLVLVK